MPTENPESHIFCSSIYHSVKSLSIIQTGYLYDDLMRQADNILARARNRLMTDTDLIRAAALYHLDLTAAAPERIIKTLILYGRLFRLLPLIFRKRKQIPVSEKIVCRLFLIKRNLRFQAAVIKYLRLSALPASCPKKQKSSGRCHDDDG